MGFSSGTSTKWLFVHCFQIELEFGNVGFCDSLVYGLPVCHLHKIKINK